MTFDDRMNPFSFPPAPPVPPTSPPAPTAQLTTRLPAQQAYMQPAPSSHRQSSNESISPHTSLHSHEELELEDDFDYLSIATPSRPNTSKRTTPNKGKAVETIKWKGKGKARNGIPGGEWQVASGT